jgi:dihydrofolate reductase
MKPVYIIVACSENRVIGKDGGLPWKIPEDSKFLRRMIKGGIVIEGRRCYEEIGKAFAGTTTLVLSRNPEFNPPDAEVFPDLDSALARAQALDHPGPIWIGGGQAVYEEALTKSDRLYVTVVHAKVEGDTFFPEWRDVFTKIIEEKPSADDNWRYTFYTLEKS